VAVKRDLSGFAVIIVPQKFSACLARRMDSEFSRTEINTDEWEKYITKFHLSPGHFPQAGGHRFIN
jgi:hypothetical protein